MYTVVSEQQFSEMVFKLEITAPLIARSRKAGHFVIVRLGEKGERVPLTIAGADVEKGTITWTFTGLVKYSSGALYYVEGSRITWKYNGTAVFEGVTYTVVNSRA